MSDFVRDVLRDCGVDIPIRVVGNGVEAPDPDRHRRGPGAGRSPVGSPSSTSARPFPARGSTCSSSRTSPRSTAASDVSLILKTFPNPHNQVGEILERLRASPPQPAGRAVDRPGPRRPRDRGASTVWPTATSIRRGAKASACRWPRPWPPACRSSAWPTPDWPTSSPRRRRSPSRTRWSQPRPISTSTTRSGPSRTGSSLARRAAAHGRDPGGSRGPATGARRPAS